MHMWAGGGGGGGEEEGNSVCTTSTSVKCFQGWLFSLAIFVGQFHP